MPARGLFDLSVSSLLLEARERRAQDAGDLVLGQQAAELMRCYADQDDVVHPHPLGQWASLAAGDQQAAAERDAERRGEDRVAGERAVLAVGDVVGAEGAGEVRRAVGKARAHLCDLPANSAGCARIADGTPRRSASGAAIASCMLRSMRQGL